jgi:hypothetical protein
MKAALVIALALMAYAVWRFAVSEWSSTWRTRRSGPANNWQNEGYMANQDGRNWSEIDGTIAKSPPPRRSGGGGLGN